MPPVIRHVRFTVIALICALFANPGLSQTREERALVQALQANDTVAVRSLSRAIENGLNSGRLVTSASKTEGFIFLASVAFSSNDVDAALRYFRLAVVASRSEGLWSSIEGMTARFEFANTLMLLNRHAEAVPILENLAFDLDQLGLSKSRTARQNLVSLGAAHMELENWDKLEAISFKVLEYAEAETPPDREHVEVALNGIAFAMRASRRPAEAVPFSRRKLEIVLEDHAPDSLEAHDGPIAAGHGVGGIRSTERGARTANGNS